MGTPQLTDAQVDAILRERIPGGSAAADWFLPHEAPRGRANVRDVVRHMVARADELRALLAQQAAASAEPPLPVARIAHIDAWPSPVISLVWHVATQDLEARGVVVDALLYVLPTPAGPTPARLRP